MDHLTLIWWWLGSLDSRDWDITWYTWGQSIPNLVLKLQEQHINPSVIFTWRLLLNWGNSYRVLHCFKSYVTSHVDEDGFKLLYESFLHHLPSIIASVIGTTLFAHINFEYIRSTKIKRSHFTYFYSLFSIIAHYCQRFFYIGT